MTDNKPSLAPSFATSASLSAALEHLAMAERVAARRNFDKWSTAKLNEAKNAVRLANFHNTQGGWVAGGFNGVSEPSIVNAGFAAQDALQD